MSLIFKENFKFEGTPLNYTHPHPPFPSKSFSPIHCCIIPKFFETNKFDSKCLQNIDISEPTLLSKPEEKKNVAEQRKKAPRNCNELNKFQNQWSMLMGSRYRLHRSSSNQKCDHLSLEKFQSLDHLFEREFFRKIFSAKR